MGVLRVLLALSVVIGHADHSQGLPGLDTTLAVRSFYVISGFYMTLVLNTKYRGKPYYVFLRSRYLRLFPAYAAVVALTVLYGLVTTRVRGTVEWPFNQWASGVEDLSLPSLATLALSNVFIVGQDILTYCRITSDGSLALAGTGSPGLGGYFLVPQAWTLGIELTFYAVAPFLVTRSTAFVTGILVASLAGQTLLSPLAGIDTAVLGYRFFPFELAFFTLGALSHRLHERLRAFDPGRTAVALAAAALLTLYLFFPAGLPAWSRYGVLAVCVPVLFSATRTIALDRFVGELSYHIYISHILVLCLLTQYTRLGTEVPGVLGTVALSLALHLLVDRKTEPWREQLARRSPRRYPAAKWALAWCGAAALVVAWPVATKRHFEAKHLASSLTVADYNLLADPPEQVMLLSLRHRSPGTADPFRYGFGEKSELFFSLPRPMPVGLSFELASPVPGLEVAVSWNGIPLENLRVADGESVYRRYTLPGRKSGNVLRFAYRTRDPEPNDPERPKAAFRQLGLFLNRLD